MSYTMYAWVELQPDGQEGVIAALIPGFPQLLPLQNRRPDMAQKLRPYAEIHAQRTGRGVRLIKLAEAEELDRVEGAEPGVYPPEPPYPIGEGNAKRAGWKAFFDGKGRGACPFPPARRDLLDGFREGWDAAAALPAPR